MVILGLMLVVAVLWIVITPSWLPAPPALPWSRSKAAPARPASASRRASATHDYSPYLNHWLTTEGIEYSHDLADRLPAVSVGLTTWLAGLPEQRAAEFRRQVGMLTVSQNLDLEWLRDGQAPRDAALKQTVSDAVLLLSAAIWLACEAHDKAEATRSLNAFLTAPTRRANIAFGQALYAGLDRVGLVQTPADLLLASDEHRLRHMARAAEQAWRANPDLFHAVLYTLPYEGASSTSPSRTPPAPSAGLAHLS